MSDLLFTTSIRSFANGDLRVTYDFDGWRQVHLAFETHYGVADTAVVSWNGFPNPLTLDDLAPFSAGLRQAQSDALLGKDFVLDKYSREVSRG